MRPGVVVQEAGGVHAFVGEVEVVAPDAAVGRHVGEEPVHVLLQLVIPAGHHRRVNTRHGASVDLDGVDAEARCRGREDVVLARGMILLVLRLVVLWNRRLFEGEAGGCRRGADVILDLPQNSV